jgi:hypothetical protein
LRPDDFRHLIPADETADPGGARAAGGGRVLDVQLEPEENRPVVEAAGGLRDLEFEAEQEQSPGRPAAAATGRLRRKR